MKQKKLQDAIKGMQVKNWEIREDSNGRRVVYVRFVPKEKSLMVEVEEV
jgi:endonuclease YncB( thermonuclease family)